MGISDSLLSKSREMSYSIPNILHTSESNRESKKAVTLTNTLSLLAVQVAMARIDKVLATLVKLAVVEDKVKTQEYSVSGLQNLAFEK